MPIFQALRTFFLSLLLFGLDRACKYGIEQCLNAKEVPWGLGCIKLQLVKNSGTALGHLIDWKWMLPLLLVIILPALLWVLHLALWKHATFLEQAIGVLAFAGGLSSLYDRLAVGYIIDVIEVHIGSVALPLFNLADVFLGLSAVLSVLHLLFKLCNKAWIKWPFYEASYCSI